MSTQHSLKNYGLSIAFTLLFCAPSVSAQSMRMAEAPTTGEWLTGDQILKEYTDTTQTGMYSWMLDGAPLAFSETHHDNTVTTYNEFGKTDFTIKGVWIVKKNVICYYYKDWRINPVNCFTVLKSGNCYYHYDDEKKPDFENMEEWNSVGYDARETPTCVPPIT